MDVRQKTCHHELCPLSCIDRSQRSKSQNERKEERNHHDQSKSHTDCRGCSHQGEEDVACPRCDRELYVFNTASGPILRCRGWTLAGAPCTLIKACHNAVVILGGLQNTNRTGGEVVADGLPLFHGAQLAIDTTLVSPVGRDGLPRPRCAREDGAALTIARRRKERTYPELTG